MLRRLPLAATGIRSVNCAAGQQAHSNGRLCFYTSNSLRFSSCEFLLINSAHSSLHELSGSMVFILWMLPSLFANVQRRISKFSGLASPRPRLKNFSAICFKACADLQPFECFATSVNCVSAQPGESLGLLNLSLPTIASYGQ